MATVRPGRVNKEEQLKKIEEAKIADMMLSMLAEYEEFEHKQAIESLIRLSTADIPAIQGRLKATRSLKEMLVSKINAGKIANKKMEEGSK